MGDVLSSASGILSRPNPENSSQDVKKNSSAMPDTKKIKTVKPANLEELSRDERRMSTDGRRPEMILRESKLLSQSLTQDFESSCDTPIETQAATQAAANPTPISGISDSEKIVSSVTLTNNYSASSRRTQPARDNSQISYVRQTIDSAIASDILSCSTQLPRTFPLSSGRSKDCQRLNSAEQVEEDLVDTQLSRRLSECLVSIVGNVSPPKSPRNIVNDEQSRPSSISSFESLSTEQCTISNREDNQPTQIVSLLHQSPKTNTREPESLWTGSPEFLECETPVLETMTSIVNPNNVRTPCSISIGTNLSLPEGLSPKALASGSESLDRCDEPSNDFSSAVHAKDSAASKTGNRSGAPNSAGKVEFSKDFTGSGVENTANFKDRSARTIEKRKLDRSEYKENTPVKKSPRLYEDSAQLSASSKSNAIAFSQTRRLEFEEGESFDFSEPAKKKVRLCPAGHVRRSSKTRRREIARRILTPFHAQPGTTEQRVLTSPCSGIGHKEPELIDLSCNSDDEILAKELPTDENDNCENLAFSRRNSESETGSREVSRLDSESQTGSHGGFRRNSESQTGSHGGFRRNSESQTGSPAASRPNSALETGSPTLLLCEDGKIPNSTFQSNETLVTILKNDEENDTVYSLNRRGSNDTPSSELPTPEKKKVRLCVPELPIKIRNARSSTFSRRNLTPFYAQPKNTNRHKLTPFYPDQRNADKRPRSTKLNSRAEKEILPQLTGSSEEPKDKNATGNQADVSIELLIETGSQSSSRKRRFRATSEHSSASLSNTRSAATQPVEVTFLSDRCCEYDLEFQNISSAEIVSVIPKLLKDLVETSSQVIKRNINNAIEIVDLSVDED